MKYLIAILSLCAILYSNSANAQGVSLPEEYKDLKFYRYVTNNFEILSIDDKQGEMMYENVEKIKTWVYKHWGMNDIQFPKLCFVICVPNEEMFKKFFHENELDPRFSEEESVIWIHLDPKQDIMRTAMSEKIAFICFKEWAKKHNVKMERWLHEGMSSLSKSPNGIAMDIMALDVIADNGDYINGGHSVTDIFNTSDDAFKSKNLADKHRFKVQSAVLTLLLKKELTAGRTNFGKFVLSMANVSEPEKALSIYNFSNVSQLDKNYRMYLYNLRWDLKMGRTPKTYFTWFN